MILYELRDFRVKNVNVYNNIVFFCKFVKRKTVMLYSAYGEVHFYS